MDNYRWINKGHQRVPINIGKVERQYNAQYVADLCLMDLDGRWSRNPAAIFWQETPPRPDYSNYFGILVERRQIFITSGRSVAEGDWFGAEAENGEIIFSRFRDDHRVSRDGTASVEGGRDKCVFKGKPVVMRVIGPDFSVVK